MLNLLKSSYGRMESIKGKRLLILLGVIFVIFFITGIAIGYVNSLILKNYELEGPSTQNQVQEPKLEEFEGRIQYVDPKLYPSENISYSLVDHNGKEIILLKALDQKLEVAENLNAKVYGIVSEIADNKKVLDVERINITSVAD